FEDTKLSETAAGADTLVRLNGAVQVDCTGPIRFDTIRPLLTQGEAKCPAGGWFEVTGAGGGAMAAAMRRPTPAADGGGVASALGVGTAVTQDATENQDVRHAVFRARDGTVYQVVQNLGAGASFGADAFHITTMVAGTAGGVRACDVKG